MRKILLMIIFLGCVLVATGDTPEKPDRDIEQTVTEEKGYMDIKQLPQWLTAFGTLGVVFVAVFLNPIRGKLQHPKLKVYFELKSPDCQLTPVTLEKTGSPGKRKHTAKSFFFRIRVKNIGKTSAESAEVFAHTLRKQREDGSFERVDSFLPMRLIWSHIKRPVFNSLAPHMEKHCDIGLIIKPDKRGGFDNEGPDSDLTIFSFALERKPNNNSHLIDPGNYQLELFIGASNIRKPAKETLEINFSGHWFESEDVMFTQGISIKML